jgi:hypothetical protein
MPTSTLGAAPRRPAVKKTATKAIKAPVLSDCAFVSINPCPVDRRRVFNLWGGFTTFDVRKGNVAIEVLNFSPIRSHPKTAKLFKKRSGTTTTIRVVPTTRIFIVRPDHSRVRVRKKALFVTLANYERAVMYASGQLTKSSYWNSLVPAIAATTITLDLSDGALADLGGTWTVDTLPGSKVVLKVAPEGVRRYNGEVFDAAGVRTVTFRMTQPATGIACIADWLQVGATTPEQFECGYISDAGRRLGPLVSRTPGRPPVNFTRSL